MQRCSIVRYIINTTSVVLWLIAFLDLLLIGFYEKNTLKIFFKMPTSFSITNFHCFTFDGGHPECISAKTYFFSQAKKISSILNAGTTVYHVRNIAARVSSNTQYRAKITPLAAVKLIRQGTRRYFLVCSVVKNYFPEDD